MTHAAVDGLRLAHCRQCLGLLVEMEAFVVLVERVRSKQKQGPAPPRPADLSQLERELKCPGCGRRMDTHPYGGPGNIIIDNCPECGLNWLDHSELRRVVTAGESSRREPAWLEV
jgi:Zn-finger nucleic acid-binding protein